MSWLACFLLALQEDSAGMFNQKKDFWHWAWMHINPILSSSEHSPEWTARTCLRRAELGVRLGFCYREITAEVGRAIAEIGSSQILPAGIALGGRPARKLARNYLLEQFPLVNPTDCPDIPSSARLMQEIEKWKHHVLLRWGTESHFFMEQFNKWRPQ